MSSLSSLFLHCFLLYLLHTIQCLAQGDNTMPWSIGMDLKLFVITGNTTACPLSLELASQSPSVKPIIANSSVTGGDPTGNEPPTSVRLTNGWFKQVPFDSTSQTFIQVAEPSAVGGGCWFSDSEGLIQVKPCGTDRGFQFYIVLDPNAGPYAIYNCDLELVVASGIGEPLMLEPNIPSLNFCVYDGATGLRVMASTTNYHFPMSQITNLTGVTVPGPDNFQPEHYLPGCELGATQDCLVARTVNGMPPECEGNPSTRKCMLALVATFCFDVPARRLGLDASDEVEACFRNVPLGPCVANPSGAACASGQFAGIMQFVSGGGNSSGVARRDLGASLSNQKSRRANTDPLFGDSQSDLPLEDQFWIGVMKNFINGAISLVNLILDGLVASARISCMSVTFRFPNQDREAAARIREGCWEAFTPHVPIDTLPLNGDVEKAGDIFADVVGLLFPAADLAEAVQSAKFVGAIQTVISKFVAKTAPKDLLAEGMYLEATGPAGDVVQVFRDAGDGKPMGVYTQGDVNALTESIGKEAFTTCQVCVTPPVKREALHPRGLIKKLCCFLSPRTLEPGGGDSSLPEIPAPQVLKVPQTIGDLANPGGLIDDANLLPDMTKDFEAWYLMGKKVPLVADPETTSWFNRLVAATTNEAQLKVRQDFIAAYKLDSSEANAILSWMELYRIDIDALQAGLPKIPPTTGLAYRAVDLPADTAKILVDGLEGPISQGEKGIYEVRDLVVNSVSPPTAGGEPPRLVMASSLAFQFDYDSTALYRFIINSKTGRYIAPTIPQGVNQNELIFVQGVSGKFKLLGYQPLNGGEEARLAGRPGPYGVFYFDEIAP